MRYLPDDPALAPRGFPDPGVLVRSLHYERSYGIFVRFSLARVLTERGRRDEVTVSGNLAHMVDIGTSH